MRKPARATVATAAIDLGAFRRLTWLTLLTAAVLLVLVNPVFAGDASPMGIVLCNAASMIMGDTGRGLATLAVIAVGVGACLGKASWGMAMTVAVGISVVFGAPSIVFALTGNAAAQSCAGGTLTGAYGTYGGVSCVGKTGADELACKASNVGATIDAAGNVFDSTGNAIASGTALWNQIFR